MNDLRESIARTAIRFSGRPVTVSPLLDDLDFPDLSKRVSGSHTKFRVVIYTGHVDPEDVEITFPKPSVLKVCIKHGPKAVDELTKREKLMTQPQSKFRSDARETNKSLVFSRDCSTYYNLPKGVKKSTLSAQWTWDGFLIIESKNLGNISGAVRGFDTKRLVPVRNCKRLDPRLNLHDVAIKAEFLFNASKKLWEEIEKIAPSNDYELIIRSSEMEYPQEMPLDESSPEEDPEDEWDPDFPPDENDQDQEDPEGEGGQVPPADGNDQAQEGVPEGGQGPPADGNDQALEGDPEGDGGQEPPADGNDPSRHDEDSESSKSDSSTGDDKSGAVKVADRRVTRLQEAAARKSQKL